MCRFLCSKQLAVLDAITQSNTSHFQSPARDNQTLSENCSTRVRLWHRKTWRSRSRKRWWSTRSDARTVIKAGSTRSNSPITAEKTPWPYRSTCKVTEWIRQTVSCETMRSVGTRDWFLSILHMICVYESGSTSLNKAIIAYLKMFHLLYFTSLFRSFNFQMIFVLICSLQLLTVMTAVVLSLTVVVDTPSSKNNLISAEEKLRRVPSHQPRSMRVLCNHTSSVYIHFRRMLNWRKCFSITMFLLLVSLGNFICCKIEI